MGSNTTIIFDNNIKVGYWGPVTANIDWCESNYVVSYYVAEFWNTITSFAVIIPSLIGALESWREHHVEFKYIIPFLTMSLVGCGTIFFHMGLTFRFQLLDEMPMIWGTAPILYAVLFINKPFKHPTNYLLAFLFFLWCAISTTSYIFLDNRLIFEGTCIAMIGLGMIGNLVQSFRIDRQSIAFFCLGLFYYAAAFLFWLIDRVYCDKLQAIRKILPLLLHPVTEFHAIWHILAAMGTYSQIMLVYRTRLARLQKPFQLGFRLGIVPYYYVPNETTMIANNGTLIKQKEKAL